MAIFTTSFIVFFACIFYSGCVGGYADEMAEMKHVEMFYETVTVSSLLPADSCTRSATYEEGKTSLELVHRFGPCFKDNMAKDSFPSHGEILDLDQARVHSIRSQSSSDLRANKATTIPASSGLLVGSGNYIVNMRVGTPPKNQTVIFDTGSDLTWIQCEPCVSCYQQQAPIFDPSKSTSYSSISCLSDVCQSLYPITGFEPYCLSDDACVYEIQYGDSSTSQGIFSTETLRLTQNDVAYNYMFGCGENNEGLFTGISGLMGLGRNAVSFVSQTANKYGKFFSYCIPSTESSTGYLSFGKPSTGTKPIAYTQLLSYSRAPSFYFISLQAIIVGGTKLSIPASVFSTSGTIIDSGTVITRLPPTAYTALAKEYAKQMSKYPRAPAFSILSVCFDLSGYEKVTVPIVTLVFLGNVKVNLGAVGTLYVISASQVCLAFAGNSGTTDVGILGNTQQRTLSVRYDVNGGKLGFVPGGCN
ncbi:hypothetical protein Droror1_Dr00009493 [Drosera rotundifolia]